ncbi:unnamed protein product [Blepharisma stoltei]|uniref:Uncharacterized protein n=1 Tax=Blepharisma stoltei TaxID=1481888 RepID=A0AAU9K1A6_9CILI|nr:unnamed protein product [Blepharisma stoltei]
MNKNSSRNSYTDDPLISDKEKNLIKANIALSLSKGTEANPKNFPKLNPIKTNWLKAVEESKRLEEKHRNLFSSNLKKTYKKSSPIRLPSVNYDHSSTITSRSSPFKTEIKVPKVYEIFIPKTEETETPKMAKKNKKNKKRILETQTIDFVFNQWPETSVIDKDYDALGSLINETNIVNDEGNKEDILAKSAILYEESKEDIFPKNATAYKDNKEEIITKYVAVYKGKSASPYIRVKADSLNAEYKYLCFKKRMEKRLNTALKKEKEKNRRNFYSFQPNVTQDIWSFTGAKNVFL